jgi:hypothetical protein
VLAIVVHHRVVERVDTLEILGVENVLRADPMAGLGAEIGLKQPQHRSQDRHAGQAELTASRLQCRDQIVVEQRVKHDAGRFRDFIEREIELPFAAHQRIKVLDRRDVDVLRRGRARQHDQGFAGRVGDKMQMKVVRLGHGIEVDKL